MALKKTRRGLKYVEENEVVTEKECTKCRELLPINSFSKLKLGTFGIQYACKTCVSLEKRSWPSSNPGYRRDLRKHRTQEQIENERETNRKYRKSKVEEYREYRKRWSTKNPDRVLIMTHNKRARDLGLVADFTYDNFLSLESKFGECMLTGSKDYQIDHFIPINTNSAGTTLGNIILLDSKLNYSKGHKNPFEWFEDNKERLNLDPNKFTEIVSYLADLNGMTCDEYVAYVYKCFDEEVSE